MAMVTIDPDLRVRRFTPLAEKFLGLTNQDIDRPMSELELPIEILGLQTRVREVMTSGSYDAQEAQDRSGHWYSIRIHPHRTQEGKVDGAVLAFVDVDTIKRAEQAVGESEGRFRLLADSAPVLIWVDDASGHRFVNRAYAQFVGAESRDDTDVAHWRRFIHPDDLARYIATYRDAAARNAPFDTQVRFRRADGQYRWMKAVAHPKNPGGTFAGFVGSKSDVTDLKEAESALLRADQNKNEFLAMLAHELRNPLAPLRSIVELLRTNTVDEATTTWALQTLDRQVRNITQLVDDLLDVSRITHGKIDLRRKPTELSALLRHTADLIRSAIESREQTLVCDLADDPMWLNADPLRLEQIVGNLLNNASKYTPRGGHIWLSARATTDTLDRPIAEVRVRDDGRGIPAESLAEIFELFAQGDRSLDRAHGGLGVGLTVARRLVELHGGSLSVYSAGVDTGSEFIIRLPIVPVEAPASAPEARVPATADAGGRMKILLIDDNIDASDALAHLLRARGFDVDLAHDAEKALAMAAASRPSAVLLDIGMPGRDGYEIARELRRQPELNGVLLIAVTGYGGAEERKRAREAGFDHYLTKPVDFQALVQLLDQRRVVEPAAS